MMLDGDKRPINYQIVAIKMQSAFKNFYIKTECILMYLMIERKASSAKSLAQEIRMHTHKKLLGIVLALSTPILSGCAPVTAMTTTITAGRSAAEERRVGEIVDDVVINNKIRTRFSKEDFKNLFAKVAVNSIEGRVLLTGSVETMDYSAQASEIAWSVPGVREVINEIEVDKISLTTRTKDSWIAAMVRTKLLLEKEIKSVNYSVEANNSVVFLTGIAQSAEELALAEHVASLVKGVNKVISYVVLKDDPRRAPK